MSGTSPITLELGHMLSSTRRQTRRHSIHSLVCWERKQRITEMIRESIGSRGARFARRGRCHPTACVERLPLLGTPRPKHRLARATLATRRDASRAASAQKAPNESSHLRRDNARTGRARRRSQSMLDLLTIVRIDVG